MHGAGRVKVGGYSSLVRGRSLHEGDDYQISFSEVLFSLLTLARSNLWKLVMFVFSRKHIKFKVIYCSILQLLWRNIN